MNRFSKDQNTIDEILPRTLQSYLRTAFQVAGILFVISYSTVIFLAAIVPMGVFYYYVQRYYLATSRELKRLESVSRSPIYSHFQETLSGVSSIRSEKFLLPFFLFFFFFFFFLLLLLFCFVFYYLFIFILSILLT